MSEIERYYLVGTAYPRFSGDSRISRLWEPRRIMEDDGLSETERTAYAKCQPLSCEHHACYSKHMYMGPKKLKKCEKLFRKWQKCFDRALVELTEENKSGENKPRKQ
eukprot:jgi/Bigna1/141653/aug1.64_g16361